MEQKFKKGTIRDNIIGLREHTEKLKSRAIEYNIEVRAATNISSDIEERKISILSICQLLEITAIIMDRMAIRIAILEDNIKTLENSQPQEC